MHLRQCQKVVLMVCFVAVNLNSLSVLHGQATSKGVAKVNPSPTSSLEPGPYYALVIGNNNYQHLNKLETAVNDANAVARMLRERYGFQTKILLDATRDQILTALVEYRRTLPESSNLLIYYAGHGHHDLDTDEAYWLPVDAQANNNQNWISADDITRDVRAIRSLHVLVISDSCYSGYLTRDAEAAIDPKERSAYLAKMLKSKSRNLMSSGGDEPVTDSGAPGHSVFAAAILESLRQMDQDNFTAADLFQRFVQPRVGGLSRQLPQYSSIRDSGHEYGDFVFSRESLVKGFTAGSSPVSASGTDLAAKGAEGWAVGDKGVILHTEDAGGTWKEQRSGTGEMLRSVGFATPQSGWAVGVSGTILHTEDAGGTWKKQRSGATSLLHCVGFATPQSGWAVGVSGTILHTEDAGGTWKKQKQPRSGTGEMLISVAFATPQSGWAVGDNGVILHTEDAGGSWKEPMSGTDEPLLSVAFATPQSGWAVGISGTILHTADGGGHWEPQGSGTSVDLDSVAFATPQSGWAVGARGTILHTADGGGHWEPQSSGSSVDLDSVAFATPQSGWAVGDQGVILHTADGGGDWEPQSSGTSVDLDSVAFAAVKNFTSGDEAADAASRGVEAAVREGESPAANAPKASVTGSPATENWGDVPSRRISGWIVGVDQKVILHTADGGHNWDQQMGSGYEICILGCQGMNSVTFITPQTGWAVGESGYILHSNDGGRTWEEQRRGDEDEGGELLSVTFVTPQEGWTVGTDRHFNGIILHTNNGGRTWSHQNSRGAPLLASIAFATPQAGWAVGRGGTMLHTLDGGSTWQLKKQYSVGGLNLRSVAFVTPQLGWVAGEDGTILHTRDGGHTWQDQHSLALEMLNSIAFVTPQFGWAAGAAGIILHTENGGRTWEEQRSGTEATLHCIRFVTPQVGWAVGSEGTILHTEDGGHAWLRLDLGTFSADLKSIAFFNQQ